MNRVVLFEHDRISSHEFKIDDKFRVDHITHHLGAKTGDSLKVTVIGQGLSQAQLISQSSGCLTLELIEDYKRPGQIDLSLVVATSRPPTMKKIIEHGTTLGVKHFHFFTASLSQKSYLQSKVLEKPKLLELATLGIAQSGRLWQLPSFEFSDSLDDALKKNSNAQKYLLSLRGTETLLNKKPDRNKAMAFFIGPERGWTQNEENYLIENKAEPVLLSQHTLRVETAAFALLSQIELLSLSC